MWYAPLATYLYPVAQVDSIRLFAVGKSKVKVKVAGDLTWRDLAPKFSNAPAESRRAGAFRLKMR